MNVSIAVAAVLMGLASTSPASPSLATPEFVMSPQANSPLPEIAAVHRRFSEALSKRDHQALPSFFTADILLLPADKPTVTGREAAVAFWTTATSNPAVNIRSQFDAIDSLVEGDVVVETGRATIFAVANGTETVINRGKYVVVWKREDGQWKIHRDIFNDDAPRP